MKEYITDEQIAKCQLLGVVIYYNKINKYNKAGRPWSCVNLGLKKWLSSSNEDPYSSDFTHCYFSSVSEILDLVANGTGFWVVEALSYVSYYWSNNLPKEKYDRIHKQRQKT